MEITITLVIIIITVLVSISAFNNQRIMNDLIFYPPNIGRGQWYRFFSCGLIHLDAGHLIFNMLALYLFGAPQANAGVEYEFTVHFGDKGKWIYLLMYVLALGICLIPTYIKNRNNYHYSGLGASGGVSAVVFSSILLNPTAGIGLFFIPVFVAGFIFGILYLIISQLLEKKGGGNINHSAHIFGAIFGIAFTWLAFTTLSDYDVFQEFINKVKNMDLKDIIQVGS
jgi:membrane associated rhomboid family serine protease